MSPRALEHLIDLVRQNERDARVSIDTSVGHAARARARRKYQAARILPGFPIDIPAPSHAEARAYLAAPAITCLLCGKAYRLLAGHLQNTHGVTSEEYRLAYRLPWTYGLIGAIGSTKRSNALKARLADPTFSTAWFADAAGNRQKAHEQASVQRSQPFKKELAIQNLARAGVVAGRWQESDFLRILETMKKLDLILKEVAGKVGDTPPYVTAVNWFNKTPERKAMFIHTVHSLSTAAQARAQMLGPRVWKEVQALRLQGLLQKEIAQATGLCAMTVAKLLRQSYL